MIRCVWEGQDLTTCSDALRRTFPVRRWAWARGCWGGSGYSCKMRWEPPQEHFSSLMSLAVDIKTGILSSFILYFKAKAGHRK